MHAFNSVVNTVATALIAIFTYLVWVVQRRQHELAYFARLRVAVAKANFTRVTKEVRLEVVLVNESTVPAVIQGWEALVTEGAFRETIADGRLCPTSLLKVMKYVGGPGWVVLQAEPTALSLTKVLGRVLTENAKIEVKVSYAGGSKPQSSLDHSVSVTAV